MLESKKRTPEETAQYLKDLKNWLLQTREDPAEGMTNFFATRLDKYEDVHMGNWGAEYREIAEFFDEGLASLLDIGCGTGLELEAMFKRFPQLQVTGIDLSSAMLGRLRENFPGKGIRLIQGDYFQVPFREEAFDAALSFETLHHFDFQKKQAIYEKLHRALAPGGYYIECDYIACCPEEETLCQEHLRRKREKSGIPESQFIHIDTPLTWEHQKALLENAGFQQVRVLYERESTMVIRGEKG